MSTYVTGEMDRCIERAIVDFEEAHEKAEKAADDRDRAILIMANGSGDGVVFPDGSSVNV